MMGIMMDTGFLTRGVSQHDLNAFTELYFVGDWEQGSYLLNNSLSVRNLPIFREALEASRFMSDCCFVLLKRESSSEIMGILADFLLRLQEIHFVVIANTLPDEHRLSVRSEDPERPASIVIRRALDGIGSGGGHIHMGGGVIPSGSFPGENELWSLFLRAMEAVR
jgi:nanoRNase/pAp phosphatase (c-di-AMP/oligoRNAs hydrolase)